MLGCKFDLSGLASSIFSFFFFFFHSCTFVFLGSKQFAGSLEGVLCLLFLFLFKYRQKSCSCFLLGEKNDNALCFLCKCDAVLNSHEGQCHGIRRILLILIFVDRYGAAKGGRHSNYVPAPDGCIPIHLNLVVSIFQTCWFPKNQLG